jgi:hypothetical protein
MFALFAGDLKLAAINLRESDNWLVAVLCDAGGDFAGVVAFASLAEGFSRAWNIVKERISNNFLRNKKGYTNPGKNTTKWWHDGYVEELSDMDIVLGVNQSDKGMSTLGSSTRDNAISAGKAWVGDNYNTITDKSGNIIGYSSEDGMRAFRIQYKPQEQMWRANYQENMVVNNPYPNIGQRITTLKNVHVDIID